MSWKDRLSDRMIDKYLVDKLEQKKFYGVKNDFTDKEKTKIINFVTKTMKIMLSIGQYVSLFLILTYLDNYYGQNMMIQFFMVVVIIQLGNKT